MLQLNRKKTYKTLDADVELEIQKKLCRENMSVLDAFSLEDQVAIVTGADAGIGRAIAELFGQAGAKDVVSDLKKENAQGIAGSIHEAGGADFAAACDVTEIADRMHLVEKATAKAQFKVFSPT